MYAERFARVHTAEPASDACRIGVALLVAAQPSCGEERPPVSEDQMPCCEERTAPPALKSLAQVLEEGGELGARSRLQQVCGVVLTDSGIGEVSLPKPNPSQLDLKGAVAIVAGRRRPAGAVLGGDRLRESPVVPLLGRQRKGWLQVAEG